MLPDTSLLYFYEVARTGSIRHAADRLHISASAISRMIRKIEHRFQAPLFERRPDGMRLTPAGEILSQQMSSVYAQIRDAQVRIGELQGIRRGEVALYCIDAVMQHLIPASITAFSRHHPQITFTVRSGSSQEIIDALLSYSVDIGITYNMERQAGIEVLRRFASPLYALAAPAHPLAQRRRTSLKEIASYPLALPDASFGVRRIVDRALAAQKLAVCALVTTDSLAFARGMARAGKAVTLSSRIAARSELEAGQLVAVPIRETRWLTGTTLVCKRAGRELSASATELLGFIEQAFTALETGP